MKLYFTTMFFKKNSEAEKNIFNKVLNYFNW